MTLLRIIFGVAMAFGKFWTTNAAASCQSLPQTTTARLYNPCVFVTTYDFYVPNGFTLSTLENIAKSRLNNTLLIGLSASCKSSLVRYVCSMVYKKCQPNVVLTNPATYNYQIYSNDTGTVQPVPFQRPCVSVCHAVTSTCTDPLYRLANAANPVNCYATTNYANLGSSAKKPYVFDLKNDASYCYSPNLVPVAAGKERYLSGNTPCTGIVSDFFMLPGNQLNADYTVLQLPHVVQTIINTGLAASFSRFPGYLTEDCNVAIRQYFCYQYFFSPQPVTFGRSLTKSVVGGPYQNFLPNIRAGLNAGYPGILNRVILFPGYYNRSVCQNYVDVCEGFRDRAQNIALEPDCDRVLPNGLDVYPTMNQTQQRLALPLTLGGSSITLSVAFSVAPVYSGHVNTSEYSYSVNCPNRYSVNDQVGERGVNEVDGTGCAVNCIAAEWTLSEWDDFEKIAVILTAISIPLAAIVIIVIPAMGEYGDFYPIFYFAVFSIPGSAYHLFLNSALSSFDRYCKTEIQPHRSYTGPSHCLRTAVLSTLFYLMGVIIMCILSFHRAMVLSRKHDTLNNPLYYMAQALITILPPFLAIIIGLQRGVMGFSGAIPMCTMDIGPSSVVMGFPTLIISGFSYLIYLYDTLLRVYKQRKAGATIAVTAAESRLENEGGVVVPTSGAVAIISEIPAAPVNTNNVSYVQPFDAEEGGIINNDSAQAEQKTNSDDVSLFKATIPLETPQSPLSNADAFTQQQVRLRSQSTPSVSSMTLYERRMDLVYSLVIISTLVVHLGFGIIKTVNFLRGNDWYDSFVNYTSCIFRNYDGSTDSNLAVCGYHPSLRPEVGLVNLYMVCIFAPMVVVGPAFLLGRLLAYIFFPLQANSTTNDATNTSGPSINSGGQPNGNYMDSNEHNMAQNSASVITGNVTAAPVARVTII